MVIPKDSKRIKFANSLRKDLYEMLQQESHDTGIPLSKLLDKAVLKLFAPDRSIHIPEQLFTALVAFYGMKGEDIDEVISEIVATYLQKRIDESTDAVRRILKSSHTSSNTYDNE